MNQCAMCAYGHTKMALESGAGQCGNQAMLGGMTESVPQAELAGVLFAQHYADSRGLPAPETWARLCEAYGRDLALGILGAVRMIMFGNAYGIAFGAIGARFKGKPDPRSGVLYEAAMAAGVIPFALVALIHALAAALLKRPVI